MISDCVSTCLGVSLQSNITARDFRPGISFILSCHLTPCNAQLQYLHGQMTGGLNPAERHPREHPGQDPPLLHCQLLPSLLFSVSYVGLFSSNSAPRVLGVGVIWGDWPEIRTVLLLLLLLLLLLSPPDLCWIRSRSDASHLL
jgi:hypothetical protein